MRAGEILSAASALGTGASGVRLGHGQTPDLPSQTHPSQYLSGSAIDQELAPPHIVKRMILMCGGLRTTGGGQTETAPLTESKPASNAGMSPSPKDQQKSQYPKKEWIMDYSGVKESRLFLLLRGHHSGETPLWVFFLVFSNGKKNKKKTIKLKQLVVVCECLIFRALSLFFLACYFRELIF